MRIAILPAYAPCHVHANAFTCRAILRLISENAAEEAQITQEYTSLKNAGAKVAWYGREAHGGSDHMAIGLEVELA